MIDPKRIKAGWRLFATTALVWVVGLLISAFFMSSSMPFAMPLRIRLKIMFVIGVIQLAAAALTILVLFPIRRRSPRMRFWSVVMVAAVIAMTSLYYFMWITRISD